MPDCLYAWGFELGCDIVNFNSRVMKFYMKYLRIICGILHAYELTLNKALDTKTWLSFSGWQ